MRVALHEPETLNSKAGFLGRVQVQAQTRLPGQAYAKLHGSWEGLGGGGHVEAGESLVQIVQGVRILFGFGRVFFKI